ncbi:hypothetical protein HDU96_004577, partial [Phlyctochytrium bullatum]
MSTAPRWTATATRTLLTQVASHIYDDTANPRPISLDLPWNRFATLVNDRHCSNYTAFEVRDRFSALQRWWLDHGVPASDGSMRTFWDLMPLVFGTNRKSARPFQTVEDRTAEGMRKEAHYDDGNGADRVDKRYRRWTEAMCIDLLRFQKTKSMDEPWGPFLNEFNCTHNETMNASLARLKVTDLRRTYENHKSKGRPPQISEELWDAMVATFSETRDDNVKDSSTVSKVEDEGSERVEVVKRYRRWTEAMCIDLLRFQKNKGINDPWDPFLDEFNRAHNETMNTSLARLKVTDLRRTFENNETKGRPPRISRELWDAMVAAFSETTEGEGQGELDEEEVGDEEDDEDSTSLAELDSSWNEDEDEEGSSVVSDSDRENEGAGSVGGRGHRRWTEAMCIDLLRFQKTKSLGASSWGLWDPFLDKFNRKHNETVKRKLAYMKVLSLR